MDRIDLLTNYLEVTDEEVDEALNKAIYLVKENAKEFGGLFPYSNSENNFYEFGENVEWTTGFWTGQVWLAYEKTKDEMLLKIGEENVESFLDRILRKIDVNHHDMGFLYSLSCVAAHNLTGNEKAKEAAILAADNLMLRFHENGQFFQAWGNLDEDDNYRLIIDCLLNMPLLFWASKVTGDQRYSNKAKAHINTAMKYVIRDDDSTYHTYFFDRKSGSATRGVTHQGNRDGSAWARGQSWGIYGAALSYRNLKNPEYIDTFKRLTNYFINNLPDDLIPYWDFDFNTGSTEPRDSSALAITICGILEMSEHLSEEESVYYKKIASKLMKALINECRVTSRNDSNGLLKHGTYARASKNNPCNNRGVDECNTWGDYFYMEALMRFSKEWNSYW